MKKKVFKSNFFLDLYYVVMDEYWFDAHTYLIIFQDMVDIDGDTYHLEVEYHADEGRITYTRVYENEIVHGMFPTNVFKQQIDEYILQQAGVIGNDYLLRTQTINVELKLAAPKEMTVGEFQEWLKHITIEINRIVPTDKEELLKKVKVIEVNNKFK